MYRQVLDQHPSIPPAYLAISLFSFLFFTARNAARPVNSAPIPDSTAPTPMRKAPALTATITIHVTVFSVSEFIRNVRNGKHRATAAHKANRCLYPDLRREGAVFKRHTNCSQERD